MFKRKPKVLTPEQAEELRTKDFFDMILPGTVKFLSDHYILGDSYRCVWVIREYPPSTEEQAILAQLADRSGVTLRIYHRLVEAGEQRKIIQNATRRNKLKSGGNDVNETIEAEGNLQDVVELLANLRKNREPLLHVSVFLELKARSMEALRELQSDIAMELTRSKISVDRLTLRQKEGFLSVLPVGANQFGAQYERVLPASSVANLYPFNFSGKTDPQGLYIGRDKFGTNILVDFDRRAEDKTTSNIPNRPQYATAKDAITGIPAIATQSATQAAIKTADGNTTITDSEGFNQLLNFIEGIEVNTKEVKRGSWNDSEGNNKITFYRADNSMDSVISFTSDYSKIWIETNATLSFTYSVKDPAEVQKGLAAFLGSNS